MRRLRRRRQQAVTAKEIQKHGLGAAKYSSDSTKIR